MCTPTFDCSEESLAVRKRRRRSRENCSASLRRSRVSRKSQSQGRVFIVKRGRIHASVPRPGWRSSCVSVEETLVAEAMPDVIVLAWAAAGDRADPKKAYAVRAWQEVPAIQNRRVHVISDELLNTPGPPLIKGAKELWKVLNDKRAASASGG